jgi:FAD/FMN-containing dehydrogenase/Fe-S oxidoreductase
MPTPFVEPDTRDLARELTRVVDGEVRFDRVSRLLYSTDASMYQVMPVGVVLPRTEEDVIATVEMARRYGVPLLPRGGGTSLAGQTVGAAVVIDYSKYMRSVLDVDTEARTARVQPGIILDELNRHLTPSRFLFAPDPSTSNRGNVGGALGNNSCGAHSVVWGKTSDNVSALRTVLSDGTLADLGQLDKTGLETMAARDGLLGSIARELGTIGHEYGDEVAARYPKIMRRVSGYNLDLLGTGDGLDLAQFLVGSEGTLVNITEATLKLVPIPERKVLAVLHFANLIESMEATVATLELAPAAVEHIGAMILRQARAQPEFARLMDWVQGDPEAVLVVEFTGDTEAELTAKLDALDRRMKKSGLGYAVTRLVEPAAQARVWAVRRAGLGLIMNVPGPAKPLAFVEDTAVSPERLPEFVRRFDEIVRENGTEAGYYGHASVGCLHIRPLIDPKSQDGIDRMARIADDISGLVLEFGGSLSGEHGDGLVRSQFLEKMFGPSIVEAFGRVKRAFDPDGLMNPGKIVDPASMTENLRYGVDYETVEPPTALSFQREGGLAAAIEMCNGQGACRKSAGGTMCPSFMATRDEEHSTRGRANALRSAISGALPVSALTGDRVHEVMDLCLGCKACKAECPSNVDMAKLKYELLAQRRSKHGASIKDRLLGNVDRLGPVGSLLAPISNWVVRSVVAAELMERVSGIDRRRRLPAYASQTFGQWLKSRPQGPKRPSRGRVVLYNDTFTNYNHPELGRSAVAVLEALGYEMVVPNFKCCGRPQLSAGDAERARRNAAANVAIAAKALAGEEGEPDEPDVYMVGLEPSCILMFRDEYLDLLPGDETAKAVAGRTLLVDEFLSRALAEGGPWPFDGAGKKLLFHGHCQQKAIVGTEHSMNVLRSLPNSEVEEIEAGCCGMAGSFGFEKEHYDVSMDIGNLALFPKIRAQTGDFEVVSLGVSCRHQIADGTGQKARHLVEVMAGSITRPVTHVEALAPKL